MGWTIVNHVMFLLTSWAAGRQFEKENFALSALGVAVSLVFLIQIFVHYFGVDIVNEIDNYIYVPERGD